MKTHKGLLISACWLLGCIQLCSSQIQDEPLPQRKDFPIELSFFNHAVSMPFGGIVLSPIHPGFSGGTEYYYINGVKGQLFQAIHAGYFYNKYNARALFLETSLGYRYTFSFGLFADAGIGIGYLHSFHPTEIFAQNEYGEYEQVKDRGKPAFTVHLPMGIGYDLSCLTPLPISFFVRYQPLIQMPYSVEVPLFPHSKIHFGVRFHL